jgi:23S rRNA pseudouridine1911/1915/1917 synthase
VLAGDLDPSAPDPTRIVLGRQALHAYRITFDHPATGRRMTLEAPLAPDMRELLELLRRFRAPGGAS